MAEILAQPLFQDKRYFYRFDSIDSTNAEAIRRARAEAPEGLVIVADSQTAGRGRLGRDWESPPGRNLYVSFLLRPRLRPAKAMEITCLSADIVKSVLEGVVARNPSSASASAITLMGLAANEPSRTNREFSLSAKASWGTRSLPANPTRILATTPFTIKSPNDILLNGKKVAGILCEMSSRGEETSWVVVGIGINVNADPSDFSPEVRKTATSLKMEFGKEFDREEILMKLIQVLSSAAPGGIPGRVEDDV